MIFEGPDYRFWIVLGIVLVSSWGSWSDLGGLLGVLGASWRRLDGVLGRLGVLGNAEERLTMLACV